MEINTQEQKEAYKFLRKHLKPGTKVYTEVTHVSSSGMSRAIRPFIIIKNQPCDLTRYIDRLGLFKRNKKYDGLWVGGCGMDMTFHVVYELGSVLYPRGFKLSKGQYGRNGDNSGFDKDGGYALTNVHF